MINVYTIKKTIAISMGSMISLIVYMVVMIMKNNVWWSLGSALLTILIWHFIGALLIKHPFSDVIEGKGLLTMDINSTGVIRTFLVKLQPPFIRGKIDGAEISDQYDRQSIEYISKPTIIKDAVKFSQDGKRMTIEIDVTQYNQSKFRMDDLPVMLYNSQLKSVITKEFLSGEEKEAFAEHQVSYLARIAEKLSNDIFNYARAVVEVATKPQGKGLFSNIWFWVFIGLAVVILLVMFGPAIYKQVAGGIGSSVGGAVPSPITPLG